jgi:hypothetical protein
MAKKKQKRRKAATKKDRGSAVTTQAPASETDSLADQELATAGVVDAGGALLLGLAEAFLTALESRGIDVAELVRTVVANPQSGPVSEDGNRDWLDRYREYFAAKDFDESPFLRVVGRVVEVLTVRRRARRGKDTCTTGEVFRVFLEEIPAHIPYDAADYRRPTPTKRGNPWYLDRDPGRAGIRERLKVLKQLRWLVPAKTARDGSDRGYRLTPQGREFFAGWPVVDGLDDATQQPVEAG